MKKVIRLILAFILLINFGCKKDKQVIFQENHSIQSKSYSVVGETSLVKWIAYKTTDKVPVKGKFNSFKITKSKEAKTIEEALNGIIFSIPVSSVSTDDKLRDSKIVEFLFGAMKNTEFLSGTFNINESNSSVNITMNGISKTIPIELEKDGQMVTFSKTLNLNDWELKSAIESLNKVCYDLHKGPDGISKTWDEVEIKAVIYLKVTT